MFQPFKNEEKLRIFNKRFWNGFYVGVAVFVLINVFAYFYADYKYQQYLSQPIVFAPVRRFLWGFPFSWEGDRLTGFADGPLNIVVMLLFGFVFGIIFKTFSSKRTERIEVR